MRLFRVFCSVATVLGMSVPALAAPAAKSASAAHAREGAQKAPAKEHGKSQTSRGKASASKDAKDKLVASRDGQKAHKEKASLERASATRTERRVRDELSFRGGHDEPSDAELMEWLSHGAPRKSKPAAGGLTRASAQRGAPRLERSSAERGRGEGKAAEKKTKEKTEVAPKKGEESPKKGEEKTEVAPKKGEESPKKGEEKSGKTTAKAAKIIADEKKKTAAVCVGPSIEIVRGKETERMPLTRCDGKADEQGVLRLSVMARPGSAERPVLVRREEDLGAGIKKVDKGLAERIAVLATHFASKTGPAPIEIISGYRPASKGSYHSHARAMDIRVQGARNEDVVAFCKTLQDTGCGYYPNSGFVHVDVRDPGTGHISWIDASGPGETPRYVASWPPPKSGETVAGESKAKATFDKDAEEKADKRTDRDEETSEAKPAEAKPAETVEEADAPLPSKPESRVKPSAKAKPESEGDLPALPAPARAD